ncbi:MAG: IS4 family transposase [Melioribacteraceae bacterium]|nr:IS4 family transposase [Melioribacteraceae bacterium]
MLPLALHDFYSELTEEEILKIARQTGFTKRIEKKITASEYLVYFCKESIKGTVSYNDLAAKLSCAQVCHASRQAFYYRTTQEAVMFFEQILATIMKKKYQDHDLTKTNIKENFRRILIQDSTIIRLPQKLYEIFSGVKNAKSVVCNARIQGVYDLLAGEFISFSIDSYSDNDLKVAENIDVTKGDLVLRDRGYFIISTIENMKKKGADSIIRYKHKINLYDPISHKEFNLLKMLKQFDSLDVTLLCGENKNTKLRIIAAPVPDEIANLRRMKAKNERKTGKCSKELLQLMAWNIYVTTIENEDFNFQQANVLYALRWRIESIFKTWKSNLSFDKIHNVSEVQLRVLLNARFIMITLLYQSVFNPLEKLILAKTNKQLSLMKFMRFISKNYDQFIPKFYCSNNRDEAIEIAQRYCTFDKRKRKRFGDGFYLQTNTVT